MTVSASGSNIKKTISHLHRPEQSCLSITTVFYTEREISFSFLSLSCILKAASFFFLT